MCCLSCQKIWHKQKKVKLHFEFKKTYAIYLKVLDKKPALFLSFILAILLNACKSFNTSGFLSYFIKQAVHLNNNAKLTLDDIANEQGFRNNINYDKLKNILFL